MGSIIGHRIDYNGVGSLRGQWHIPSKKLTQVPPASRAWQFYVILSAARLWAAKQVPPQSPRPRPPLLLSAPNQNRHTTQAGVCCVPFESKRQRGSTFSNPQHRTEIIVNLKQPHRSQLFSVRLWSRSVIDKVILENSFCIIYVNVYMKWMILRLKYAWHRLTVIWKHWHKSIISIWKEDL